MYCRCVSVCRILLDVMRFDDVSGSECSPVRHMILQCKAMGSTASNIHGCTQQQGPYSVSQ